MHRLNKIVRSLLPATLILLSTGFLATHAAAQIPADLGRNSNMLPLQALAGARTSTAAMGALEGAIDMDEYVVGPGDIFNASVGGSLAREVTATVAADGFLVIPTVGAVDVTGMTLRDATSAARELVKSRNQNVDVWVSLTTPRNFLVHVTGAVTFPGRYYATGVGRVADVVEAATTGAPNQGRPQKQNVVVAAELSEGFLPSMRSVLIRRADGTEVSSDLMRYYTTGDLAHNPILRDGDVVFVPTYDIRKESVSVSGPIAYPGSYPFRKGDTLEDLLTIAVRPGGLENLDEVRVTSRVDGVTESVIVSLDSGARGDLNYALRPGDLINVVVEERELVSIYGFVKYPGTYEIPPEGSTISDLVEIAGGLTDESNLDAAYVERKRPTLIRGDAKSSDLDFFGRTYYAASEGRNRLAVDVSTELDQPSFKLRDGDTVVFPRREETVFVTGNVTEPGYVPFVANQNADYYLGRVGGILRGTEEIYTFEMARGRYHRGTAAPVGPGDTIFANREPIGETAELQALLISQESAARQARLSTIQTVISGVTAVAAIITTVVAIGR